MATIASAPPSSPNRNDRFAIGLFLVLVTLAEAALTVAMTRVDPMAPAAGPIMFGIMWAPGIAALFVQLATQRSLRGMGWKPGPLRYWAIAYVLPLIYGGLCLIAAQLLGGGTINFERWATGAARWGMTPYALNGMLIQMTVLLLPGLVMGLGEEIGWRGFLTPRLAKLFGFWGVVNASYAIWLAFHLPGMFAGGYHGQGTPIWYSLICFAVLLYPATVLMTWLRLRSGSFWPAAIHHAAHNTFIQIMWNSAVRSNVKTPWLLGEFGAVTPVIVGTMVALLLWRAGRPVTEAEPR